MSEQLPTTTIRDRSVSSGHAEDSPSAEIPRSLRKL